MKKLILISCLLLLTSCVNHSTAPKVKQFSLVEVTGMEPATRTTGEVLRVLPVTVASEYSGKSFIYRTGKDRYLSDPYRQFLASPDSQISQYILENIKTKQNVISGENLLMADYVLQTKVTAMYADYRNKSQPQAVVAINVVLYSINEGIAKEISQAHFEETSSIMPNNSHSLMQGYQVDLSNLVNSMSQFVQQAI